MDILFILIPLSVALALLILGALGWAVWRGQFEGVDAEGERILRIGLIFVNSMGGRRGETREGHEQGAAHERHSQPKRRSTTTPSCASFR